MWKTLQASLSWAVLSLLLGAAPLYAQSAPPTLNDHTVYGRIGSGTGSGPGQAIPFPTLSNLLVPNLAIGARIVLTANQNFYVNGNPGSTATCGPAGVSTCVAGLDTNTCLTAATACLTLQHVVNLIYNSYDISGHTINVYLAHNTGTTNYDLICSGGSWVSGGVINVIGDSSATTATVVQDPNSGLGLQVKDLCTIDYNYISFIDSASTNASGHIFVGSSGNAGHVDLSNITFGAMTAGQQLTVGNLGSVTFVGPATISGGAPIAFVAQDGGLIDTNGQTITVSGTPAFSTSFAYIPNNGAIKATPSTFSGSATGPQCIIFAAFYINGYDPNDVFPGNSACVQNQPVGAVGIQNGSTYGYGTSGQVLTSGGGASAKDVWTSALTGITIDNSAVGGTTPAAGKFTSLNASGQITSTAGTPTIASGACGATTNGAVVSGSTNQSGQITIGSAATTTCTISWSATLAVVPNACVFFPMNSAAAATGTTVARVGAPTNSQVVLTGSALANANYAYLCL